MHFKKNKLWDDVERVWDQSDWIILLEEDIYLSCLRKSLIVCSNRNILKYIVVSRVNTVNRYSRSYRDLFSRVLYYVLDKYEMNV